MPFMDLDTNTVYIGLMVVCSNIFRWIKSVLVKTSEGIEIQHRTKRVFMKYIVRLYLPSLYAILAQTVLVLFSSKNTALSLFKQLFYGQKKISPNLGKGFYA
ncbi:MAG: hypothetical protein M9887_04555 [Chitinophagales bacterium]|nr:hypothetical protein [Chitinophagales bacterium]